MPVTLPLPNQLAPGGGGSGFIIGVTPIAVTGSGPFTVSFAIAGETRGDLVYRDAAAWTRLPADTAGKLLQTNSTTGAPSWTLVTVANTANGGLGTVTVPGAYPYPLLETDYFVPVDSSALRTVTLPDGTTYKCCVVADGADLSGTNAITVTPANAAKKLNGTVAGTVSINTNGAQRGFWRDLSGNWHGGV